MFVLVLGLTRVSNLIGQTTTLTVTSTGDHIPTPLPGELRKAINDANAGSGTYIIEFALGPATSAPYVIQLNGSLPPIHHTVQINGISQAGYQQGNPSVIIDGSNISALTYPTGLKFNTVTDGAVIGLYLRNFNDALVFTSCTGCTANYNVINRNIHGNITLDYSDECVVKGNYINTDKDLTSFTIKSEEGIFFTNIAGNGSIKNTIGGTQCGDANTILYTGSEGIDNNPSYPSNPTLNEQNFFSGNIIYNNGYDAIQLRARANHNKAEPMIITTGCTTTGTAEPHDVIELFGSTGPSGMRKNANVYMKTVTADNSGHWTADFDFIEFPFVTATATNGSHNTSGLSPAKSIPPSVFNFTYPTSLCSGTPITFTNISTSCSGNFVAEWDFGDTPPQTALSSSSTHTFTHSGSFNVTMYWHPAGETVNACTYKITKNIQVVNCCPTCSAVNFTAPTLCLNTEATFTNTSANCEGNPTFQWNFGDGSSIVSVNSTNSITHTYTTVGTYTITLTIPGTQPTCGKFVSKTFTVTDCTPPCENCIGSFAPDPGDYILSAWVKEEGAVPTQLAYTNPKLFIDFLSTSNPVGPFTSISAGPFVAQGAIIDGWQRAEVKFTIPTGTPYLNLRLQCGVGNCFFDDIRIFPTNGSVKSYVYDPINLRLVAELDERNYATFYEYDEEGKLIRVKKETEKGIMTIKENRNSTKKK